MSLFARLFSTNKPKKSTDECSFNQFRPFPNFEKNNVRVILFRECDWRGRKLLFDSRTVEKVPLDPKTPLPRPRRDSNDMIVEVTKGFGYKYKRPLSDTNTLGETIFGSIAMATKGPSLKVHVLKDPPRLMFTKIFQAPRSGVRKRQPSDEKVLDDSQGSSMNSLGDNYTSCGSYSSRQGSFEMTVDDSGFVGGRDSSTMLNSDWLSPPHSCGSYYCPLHPPASSSANLEPLEPRSGNSSSSLASNSSLSSMRRRWARSVATTLDLTINPSSPPPPTPGKRTKLGVAVVIPLSTDSAVEMEQYMLERLTLVNNMVTRLQHSVERAYSRRDGFVHCIMQATLHVQQSMYELVCGYRMSKPLWLTLSSSQTTYESKRQLSRQLVQDLTHLLSTLDTKDTNFFVTTLLTAVLTHHLGWVSSVIDSNQQSANILAELSRSHPYNALWAQLGDLQGAVGYPPRTAKTVVVGKSQPLLQKLVSVLSYFIRCGEVSESELLRDEIPDEENTLEYLVENRDENQVFNKDAIREFNQVTEPPSSPSSSCTLTKSRTVLSMKTFCMMDGDVDNANSLESGFESCNDCLADSFDDQNQPLHRINKVNSCVQLLETSFVERELDDGEQNDEDNKLTICCDKSSSQSVVTLLESEQKHRSKVESEKQFTSANLLNIVNRMNSGPSLKSCASKTSLIIKENVFNCELTEPEENESKVVFVLGENEELINLKAQDEINSEETFYCSTLDEMETTMKPPTILIDMSDVEENKTEHNKTDFSPGDVNSRVLICRSTPIEIESSDSKSLKPNPLHRCLSVPEEAVSETDWVRCKRSKEALLLVRRWLSDSAIKDTHHKPFCETGDVNVDTVLDLNSVMPASVFRTSNRPLVDTKTDSLKCLNVSSSQFEVPVVEVVDVDMPRQGVGDDCLNLPPIQSVEGGWKRKNVAESMFGWVRESWCEELVLQAVTDTRWVTELPQALSVQAHSDVADTDSAEAVCIVANTDTWEVEVVGVRGGVRVGMSPLVANIMETTHQLSCLSVTPEQCLSHIENKLMELCTRSHALAELLLNSDFLDIHSLTSTLDLDPNDVPLLLSVASTHTPLVTRKYGLSFQ